MEMLETIIEDAGKELGTVDDEKNIYRDLMKRLNELLGEAKDPRNWEEVVKKYNKYMKDLDEVIIEVPSGAVASSMHDLSFSEMALLAAGTASMVWVWQ
jgi:hypothetical protein